MQCFSTKVNNNRKKTPRISPIYFSYQQQLRFLANQLEKLIELRQPVLIVLSSLSQRSTVMSKAKAAPFCFQFRFYNNKELNRIKQILHSL